MSLDLIHVPRLTFSPVVFLPFIRRTDNIRLPERIFKFLCFFMLDSVKTGSLNWAKKVSWWGSKSKGFG